VNERPEATPPLRWPGLERPTENSDRPVLAPDPEERAWLSCRNAAVSNDSLTGSLTVTEASHVAPGRAPLMPLRSLAIPMSDQDETVTVTYYCPHCEALAELERDAYLADKAVTPFPFEGWEYATPDEEYESAEGVRFVCGDDATLADEESEGCGKPFYLSFVKYDGGREVDPRRPAEYVDLSEGVGPRTPRGPSGPTGRGN
jgi:hypothetical protein